MGTGAAMKIVSVVIAIAMLAMTPGWTALDAREGGMSVLSDPHPRPLLAYKESSSGLDQPAMEGGETELEAADIDMDGNIDLLSIGDHGSPYINTQEHGVMVWYNDGTAKWSIFQNGDWGYGGIAIGDIDNDGKWDIAYGMHHNYSKHDLGNQVMEAAIGDGTGKAWTAWGTGLGLNGQDYGMMGTDLGDFNKDGWMDIGSTAFGCCDGVHTYINNHDGTWKHTGIRVGGNGNGPDNFEFADFNNDGNLDLITGNEMGPIFFGDGKGGWTLKSNGITGNGGGGSAGDVNNDGYADYANTDSSYLGAPQVFLWDNSSQSWKNSSSGLNKSGYMVTDLVDMNNDGNLDLVASGEDIGVWTGDGTGKWTLASTVSLGKARGSVVVEAHADFDHNGYSDIAMITIAIYGTPPAPHVFLNDAPSQPSATLAFPRGGERFYPGSAMFVDYLYSPAGSGTVKLELSTTGSSGPWTTMVDNHKDGGRYQWTVPDTPSKNCYIKVIAGSASGMNARPFEILGSSGPAPVVAQVTAPNGGENWTVGDQHDVSYTISGGKSPFDVTLEYSVAGASGPWKSITTQNGVAGSGKYAWTIPNDPSTTAFVKASVKDSASQTGSDASNAAFTICAPPPQTTLSYAIINPSTPQSLNIGDNKQFSAKAFDTKGKEIATATFAWSVTGVIGDVSPYAGASTTFTATTSGAGSVKVIATYSSKTATNSTEITVIKPGVPPLDKVTISPPSVSGDIGKSFKFTAIAKDVNGTDITNSVTFTWTIAVPDLADLNPSGKTASVELRSAGETTVTVKAVYNGVTKTATASVKVTKPQTEFPWWIFMVLIAVVALIIVLLFITGRRKKKQASFDWGGQGPQW